MSTRMVCAFIEGFTISEDLAEPGDITADRVAGLGEGLLLMKSGELAVEVEVKGMLHEIVIPADVFKEVLLQAGWVRKS
jgi:hypothetical protein